VVRLKGDLRVVVGPEATSNRENVGNIVSALNVAAPVIKPT